MKNGNELTKRNLTSIVLAWTLALAGCGGNGGNRVEDDTPPGFVVTQVEDDLQCHQYGFTYKPHTVQSSMFPELTFLDGVIVERDGKSYVFYDPLADGRLLNVKNAGSDDGYYGRQGMLPEPLKQVVDSAGEVAEAVYRVFRHKLCDVEYELPGISVKRFGYGLPIR